MEHKTSGFSIVLEKSIYYEFINQTEENCLNPIIIFLHEGLGCSAQWRDFPENISNTLKCPVLLYDRYGYGKSEKINEKRSTDFLNKEALEYLPELINNLCIQNRKIILFGHSDGGSIALIYATAFPENIIGVITEAAHVFIEDISVQGIQNVEKEYQKGKLKERLQRYHGTKTETMVESWTQTWLTPAAKMWNIEHLLPKIKCPVLAVQGTDDNYGTYAQLESIKRNTGAKTELLYLDGCGHTPHLQARERVLQKTKEFYLRLQ